MSDRSFLQRALNIHPRGVVKDYKYVFTIFGVAAALFGSYMAGATQICCHLGALRVHHTTMHDITSFHAKPHT